MRNFIFLVRGSPKKWGFSVLAKKPEIYDSGITFTPFCATIRQLADAKSISL